MLKRIIPSSGERLPAIGLGTWQQFDVETDNPVTNDLLRILNQMQDAGSSLIDSSPMYGKSERIVGELTAASKRQDDFFYATKVWTRGKKEGIEQMLDSMAKMKRQVMDLMQVHNLLDLDVHLNTLKNWKEEGKIRYIGITHYQQAYHKKLEEIIIKEKIDFVQFNYSIATRYAENSLLNTAQEKGVAVIINEPLEKGKLFSDVQGRALPGWAKDYQITNWSTYFLKYILSHPAVTCVIPGTSNPKHMADILSAGYGEMPDQMIRNKMIDYYEAK